ncbi:MAG: hypothetical protein QM676_07615 [Novosphingobium sp.]
MDHRPLLAGLMLTTAACGPELPEPEPPWQSYRWQVSHCPKAEALEEIRLGGDRVAPVTILQMGQERLYIPSYWLRRGNDREKPLPNGVTAAMGGTGHLSVDLDPLQAGTSEHTYCLGTVHRIVPDEASRRGEDDFTLSLKILRTTSGNKEGQIEQMQGPGYPFNVLSFNYNADAAKRDWFDQAIAEAVGQPRTPFAEGWFKATIQRQHRPGAHIYFQTPADVAQAALDQQLIGYQALADIRLNHRLTTNIRARSTVAYNVAPSRWESYRGKARAIFDWLKTRPTQRDNDWQIIF